MRRPRATSSSGFRGTSGLCPTRLTQVFGGKCRLVNLVNEMLTTRIDTTALANRLRPVLLKLNRELRREIHSLGVTGGRSPLLVQIKRAPGIGGRELAARERVSVPGMSKFVARLENAGLIERQDVGG